MLTHQTTTVSEADFQRLEKDLRKDLHIEKTSNLRSSRQKTGMAVLGAKPETGVTKSSHPLSHPSQRSKRR